MIENLDLGNAATTINLATTGNTILRNIVLPTNWVGSLTSGTVSLYQSVVLNNCDFAGTNYILHRKTRFGDVYSETTIVRSGGASDGTTPLSWKMVSLAASGTFPITALQTGEGGIWIDASMIGVQRTVSIEFVHDNVTGLKNNEIWPEVSYYGSASNPQGTLASGAMANVLSTPATWPASSKVWNGTGGMANPNKQTMTVSFTPQLVGFCIISIKLCNSAYTAYVDLPPQRSQLT